MNDGFVPSPRAGEGGPRSGPGEGTVSRLLPLTPAVFAILLALAFATTNGIHDASNAIATLVATRAARPGQAIVLASVLDGRRVADGVVARLHARRTHPLRDSGVGLAHLLRAIAACQPIRFLADCAKDIAAFLMWTAEPHLEQRKRVGMQVIIFLIVLAGLLYFTKKKVWHAVELRPEDLKPRPPAEYPRT